MSTPQKTMSPSKANAPRPPDASDYAALRRGGVSPGRTRAQLGLDALQAARFETGFRSQVARGAGDSLAPKFARHDRHVAAVLAQGGFPALTERRKGGGSCAGLPLIWPDAGARADG